jgi:hypothetical protein
LFKLIAIINTGGPHFQPKEYLTQHDFLQRLSISQLSSKIGADSLPNTCLQGHELQGLLLVLSRIPKPRDGQQSLEKQKSAED